MNAQICEADLEFFGAFADLLEKYPEQKERYNLRLNHTHFDIADNEVLFENHDEKKRLLTTKVISADRRPSDVIDVEWRVTRCRGSLKVQCLQVCCGDDMPPPPSPDKIKLKSE